MSGTIIISKGAVWSVGSHAFFPVVNMTRNMLSARDREDLRESFSPLDEAADMVVLNELDSDRFNRFVRATRAMYDVCRASEARSGVPSRFYAGIMKCWRELLDLLERDPRYAGEEQTNSG